MSSNSLKNNSLSVAEIRAIDENAEFLGVPRLLLMENAGRAIVEEIAKRFEPRDLEVLILAYIGNKGGDGFVVARQLASLGSKVTVILLERPERIASKEARLNFEALLKMERSIRLIIAPDSAELKKTRELFEEADVIVDALLGTGIRGPLREPVLTAVEAINASGKFVVSIDVPTGVDPDTGEVSGKAVTANLTITHHKPKKGFANPEAKPYLGELVVASIGIPPEAEFFAGPGDLRMAVKKRSPTSHKGENGRVLIVGGSKDFSGAPALAALAALRAGVDLAYIAAPSSTANAIRSFSPNLIVCSYPGEYLTEKAFPMIEKLLPRCDAVAVGPGLGLEAETMDSCLTLIEKCSSLGLPMVVDADAIKALARNTEVVKESTTVITPHAGEFKILTGVMLPSEAEDWEKRIEVVKENAGRLGVTLLLKAHYDIITDGERVKVNRTGSPGMTVGGTGDVLTGITLAFLAQGASPFRAAVAAAFINGYAGELLSKKMGYHFTALDLVETLPEAFSHFNL